MATSGGDDELSTSLLNSCSVVVQQELVGFPADYTSGTLKVLQFCLIHAKDLPRTDVFGLSDPYAVIKVYKRRRDREDKFRSVGKIRSKTIKNSLNPSWRQNFLLRVDPDRTVIELRFYDANRITRDDFLGICRLDLREINVGHLSPIMIEEDLQPRNDTERVQGKATVVLKYADVLHVGSADDSEIGERLQRSLSITTATTSSPAMSGDSDVGDMSASGRSDLPENWERRVDTNGRVYYVNHIERRTQWEHPSRTIGSINSDDSASTVRRGISANDSLEHGSGGDETVMLTPDSMEEPIPAGFQMARAPNGRVFFVDHRTQQTTWIDPRTGIETPKPDSSSNDLTDGSFDVSTATEEDLEAKLGKLDDGWDRRVDARTGRVFFVDHIRKVTTWEDPRLTKLQGPAMKHSPHFKRKYDALRSMLPRAYNQPNKIDIKIARRNILEDSFNEIQAVSDANRLKTKLWIDFRDVGDEGLDYGGVQREFFLLLSKEMFNPYYGLFMYSAIDDYTLQINPNSGQIEPDHLNWFYFFGRICGLAVFHGRLLDGFFIRPFYKRMLGIKCTLDDLESVDIEFYNSLNYILNNEGAENLCLNFTTSQTDVFRNDSEEIELKEGGKEIEVNDYNKMEYVQLLIDYRLEKRIGPQMQHFMKGFEEFVPRSCLHRAQLQPNEMELLLGGIQTINVTDWKNNTMYKNEYTKQHETIILFWKFVTLLSNEQRSKLLQYVTGTSKVPPNGFATLYGASGPQKFTITRWGSVDLLPQAHTCFNRLELPPYDNYGDLRNKLLTAMEYVEGFGTD